MSLHLWATARRPLSGQKQVAGVGGAEAASVGWEDQVKSQCE